MALAMTGFYGLKRDGPSHRPECCKLCPSSLSVTLVFFQFSFLHACMDILRCSCCCEQLLLRLAGRLSYKLDKGGLQLVSSMTIYTAEYPPFNGYPALPYISARCIVSSRTIPDFIYHWIPLTSRWVRSAPWVIFRGPL